MDKILYKHILFGIKFIPYCMAALCFVNTICCGLGIVIPFMHSLGFVSPILLVFLYLSSYAFKFCEYHRLPLHYIVANKFLNTLDYWIQWNIMDYYFVLVHMLLFGFFAIMCGILKLFKKI